MYQLLLGLASPLQGFIAPVGPTHGFIDRRALDILAADGRRLEAAWLSHHFQVFRRGNDWADTGFRCVAHMYNPETGRGLKGWPDAMELFHEYCDAAPTGTRSPRRAG